LERRELSKALADESDKQLSKRNTNTVGSNYAFNKNNSLGTSKQRD